MVTGRCGEIAKVKIISGLSNRWSHRNTWSFVNMKDLHFSSIRDGVTGAHTHDKEGKDRQGFPHC